MKEFIVGDKKKVVIISVAEVFLNPDNTWHDTHAPSVTLNYGYYDNDLDFNVVDDVESIIAYWDNWQDEAMDGYRRYVGVYDITPRLNKSARHKLGGRRKSIYTKIGYDTHEPNGIHYPALWVILPDGSIESISVEFMYSKATKLLSKYNKI